MHNSKITRFLKCLSKAEIREFGKFVRSPYHNNRKDVIRFYDALIKYYPDFTEGHATKENLFKKLYPAQKYRSEVIVLLSSYLFNLGRDFMAISDFMENEFLHRYHYLNSIDKHRADSLFESEYKNTAEFMNGMKMDNDYFKNKSLMEMLYISFNVKRNRQGATCANNVEYSDYSIYSFLVQLSCIYHDLLADKSSFNYDFTGSAADIFVKHFDFEGFMKNLQSNDDANYNYTAYYYYLLMSNYYPHEESYYKKLKEYSFKDFDKLHLSEKSARFDYLIDYCIYKMEMGSYEFLRESFELYSEALEKKIFQTGDKVVGLMFFRNFITIGLAAKENEYIERFINEYGSRIAGEGKADLLELSYAMLNYEKKQYDKALECISRISNAIPLFRLATKNVLLKIYYDTNQYDSFFSLIDAYKHYLKNDKIVPDHIKNAHLLLLNYSGRLAKIKSTGNSDGLYLLKSEIKENAKMDFRHRFWLIEKSNELQGN
jgi:hypothetical protein